MQYSSAKFVTWLILHLEFMQRTWQNITTRLFHVIFAKRSLHCLLLWKNTESRITLFFQQNVKNVEFTVKQGTFTSNTWLITIIKSYQKVLILVKYVGKFLKDLTTWKFIVWFISRKEKFLRVTPVGKPTIQKLRWKGTWVLIVVSILSMIQV